MTKSSASLLVRLLVSSAFLILCFGLITASLPPAAMAQAIPPSGPRIWLQTNQPLPVQHVAGGRQNAAMNVQGLGQGQPVSMAAGDLDQDGVQDLVVGYRAGAGGYIVVHRGNLDAFAPQSDASFKAIARGEFPSPFHLEAQTFDVPVTPDFIAVGNFTGSGHQDLAVAARGGSSLFILAGDGQGGFGNPQSFTLPGGITALTAGQVGQGKSVTDLVVGLSVGGKKSLVLVIGGFQQGPLVLAQYSLNGMVSNIALGDLDGDVYQDATILAGGKVYLLHGSSGQLEPLSLQPSGNISAIALGSFIFDRDSREQIALLTADGTVHIAVHGNFDSRPFNREEIMAMRMATVNGQPNPVVPPPGANEGWQIVENFSGVGPSAGQTPLLFRTRISGNSADDVMVLSGSPQQLALISHPNLPDGSGTFLPGQVSMRGYTGSAVAALPMRVNVDGRPGVVAVHQGEIAPSLSMPLPDPVFNVDTTNDVVVAGACTTPIAGSCSLREAIIEANAAPGVDTINVPAGTYTLTIADVAPDKHDATQGELSITDGVNIIGAVDGSGNPTTIIQACSVLPTPSGVAPFATCSGTGIVEKPFSVNPNFNKAFDTSFSNLEIRFGFNPGTFGTDGFGGGFDWEASHTGTMTVTNCNIHDNAIHDGSGGGITATNTGGGTGQFTISSSTVSNNIAQRPAGNTARGGGIFFGSATRFTITNTHIDNNKALTSNGEGGGIFVFNPGTTPTSVIHGGSFTGNQATIRGGGVRSTAGITIDQSTVISNNTAQEGAGLWTNLGTSTGFPSGETTSLTKVAITANNATGTGGANPGGGGGIKVDNSASGNFFVMSFSRLAANTSTFGGSNLHTTNPGGAVTASNNWWGTNAAANTIGGGATVSCPTPGAGQVCFDPFIVLTHTASPQKIRVNQSTTLTGDMSKDNHGNGAALSGNLDEIVGLPITFDSPVLGTIPQAQPETLGNLVPTATATFNAGGTAGLGSAHATVDQAVVPVNSNLIASATESGTTATITTVGAHGFSTGEFVSISGVGVVGYNGSFFKVLSTPTATTFTYTANASGLANSSGGTANAGIVILQPPSITKNFSPTTIQTTAGTGTTVSTITFSLTNGNVVPIDSSFTDNLPSNVGVVPGSLVVATTPNVVNNCGGTVTANAGAGTISFANPSLPAGACTVTVNVQSAVDNIYGNSVTINSADAGNGNTTPAANLTVINPPHIVKVFGATTIPLNGTTSLTITVNSTNQNQTLSGITFTDSLPAGLVVATPGNPSTTCTGGVTATDGSSTVSLGSSSLAPGASCTVSVTVKGTTAGVKSNSVAASDTTAGTGNTANATLTVVAPPTISKAFNPTSIALNGTSTLTFTISNPNTTAAGDLTGVAFSDTLPLSSGSGSATLVVSSTPNVSNTCNGTVTATAGTAVISLSGGSVAHNASCTLSVDLKGTVEGDANNTTGAITSTQGGTGTTSNTALLKVVAPPTISKAFGAASIPLNGTTTVTFTIINPASNTSAENGIAFSDTLTNGLQVASTPGVSNTCGGTVTATANSTSISLSGGSIATPGASCTIVVNITGTQSGSSIPNTTGAVSSTNGGTGATSNTATLTVASPPTINKAFGASTIPLNGTTSVTFTINNPNSNVTLNGVAFTDNLPAGLVVASTPNVSNTCSGTASATAGASFLSLSSGVVNQGTSCTLSVDLQGTTAGPKLNTTTAISSTEGGTGTTSNTATLTVVAPPTISKAFNPAASIPLNGVTTVTFTISNPNTTAAGDLTGVAFSDTLPSATGTLLVAPTPNVSNTCNGTVTATAGAGVISLSGGTVAHNVSCTLSVDVKGTVAGSANNTTGSISSTQGGTGTTSNTAPMTVVAPPTISKAFGATNISLNGTTTVTFTITNPAANTNAENGTAFSDTLTNGLQVASTPGVSNTCGGTVTAAANSTSISLSGGSIATPGTSCTIVVNVTGTQSGTVSNTTGAVSSTNGGTGATSNTATLIVASPPTIQKAFNPTSIPLNGTTTVTFTVTNPNSNVALNGVAFTDNLPAGLVVASTPNVSNTCSGTASATAGASSLSLSSGVVNQGTSCTLSVDLQGTSAGTKLNTTGPISSTEGGTGTTSNTATLTVAPASTTTAVTSSSNPSVFGQSVTFTATVTNSSAGSTGAPTGSVQFVVDGVNFGSPVALTGASSNTSTATSAAIATLSVAGSPHSVTANYVNVDGNFSSGSGSLSGGQTVTAATTATTVISSSNPSVFGQAVTFTATVTDISAGSTAQPTGAVQFVVDGVNFGSPVVLTGASSNSSTATSAATATLSLAGSPHSVTANYVNADGNFINSAGSLIGGQVVNQAATTTTVTSSQGTITLGDTVTFTATVSANPPGSGTPTGIVTFFDGATPIGNGLLNNGSPDQATFSTSVLSVGSHSITAVYHGDASFTASPLSSPIAETVNLRGTTTSVALNPATVGAGQASTTTVTVTDGGASTPPGTPDTFSPTGAPATGRTGFTATLIADGAVVVIGGSDANNVVLNSAEVYTVSGGTFTPTPGNLNTARTGAVAVLLSNGKVLIAGGSSNGQANGALNSAELLDLKTGTFAPSSQSMTAARFGTTATLLNNGKVLLAGGANSGGVLNSAELYDPATDTFTATGNLNAARTGASATLLGTGKVLVAGGSSNGAAGGARNNAELFDPAGNSGAGSFSSVAGANPTLATGRWQPAAALLLTGKVLVAGGQDAGGPLTSADLYDPVADSFTATTHQMNDARANGSAVTLPNGMVQLPGGTTSQAVDLYDADSDRFDSTGSLLNHDNGLVATLLNNGQVLVVGLANGTTSDAELYSPSFNPLGTVGLSSSEPTDVFGPACVLTPSTSTASVCTSTVTPIQVATSPHTITGTYPADAVHSGSSNSAGLTVIPTAPPTIAKAFGAGKAAQNSTVGVSFTIVNPNPGATLTGISFTDALPAGLVVATPNNLSSDCGGTVTAVAGSSSISLTGGTVAPPGPPPVLRFGKAPVRQTVTSTSAARGQCVISLNLLVTGTGTISNTTGPVSANESGPGNPSNTATLDVVLAPTSNKAFGAASIPLNGTTSLTFNIANPNTSTTLVGITLTDTLPSGLVVANPNGLTGSCVASSLIGATPGGNSINLSALNLAASGSCSFSVNVTGTTGGTKNNTTSPITGTFDDGSGTFRVISGGTASASIDVVAPPVISKAFVPAGIAPTGVSALTFTITNPAANSVAETGVAFTDTLPANVVVATPNGLSGSCGGTVTATAGTGTISLTGGSVAAGTSCVFSVNVTSSVIGSYTNTTGAVSSTNGGTGNTTTAVLTVATASLSITKTHNGNFPRNSTGNNYAIIVSNAAGVGPTIGTVTVTDTLPAVQNTLVATALSGTGWACTLNTLTCTRNDVLAPGSSYPAITLTVTVPQNIRANVTNSATVSGGGDPNNHTATDPTHIGPPIVITSIDSGAATVIRGNAATFLFQVDTSGVVPQPAVVNFTCSGLPAGAACIFGPLATGQTVSQMTLTITTLGNSNSASLPGGRGIPPTYAALLFPVLGLVGIGLVGGKRKNVRLRLVMMLAGLLVLAALAGCGGNALVTARGQSTITVTATADSAQGPVSGSTTVTLTVQ